MWNSPSRFIYLPVAFLFFDRLARKVYSQKSWKKLCMINLSRSWYIPWRIFRPFCRRICVSVLCSSTYEKFNSYISVIFFSWWFLTPDPNAKKGYMKVLDWVISDMCCNWVTSEKRVFYVSCFITKLVSGFSLQTWRPSWCSRDARKTPWHDTWQTTKGQVNASVKSATVQTLVLYQSIVILQLNYLQSFNTLDAFFNK